ncbi:MAG: sulfite exporter TauE/SafE family protein, partial [Alphaproteobacteria bacterium]
MTQKKNGPESRRSLPMALGTGAAIGTLGGLVGLGGAEFRLPFLLGAFRFAALEAVIVNKAVSLVVVAFALPFRTGSVPLESIAAQWVAIISLLAGSLPGVWVAAGWATRLRSEIFGKVMAVLLALIALVLFIGHDVSGYAPSLTGVPLIASAVGAGFLIGAVAALLGVAGGELLIPTLIFL